MSNPALDLFVDFLLLEQSWGFAHAKSKSKKKKSKTNIPNKAEDGMLTNPSNFFTQYFDYIFFNRVYFKDKINFKEILIEP